MPNHTYRSHATCNYRCPVHGEFEVEQRTSDVKLESCPMKCWGVALHETTDYGSPAANARWRSAKYIERWALHGDAARKSALDHYAMVYPSRTYEVVGLTYEGICGQPVESLLAGGTSAKDGCR